MRTRPGGGAPVIPDGESAFVLAALRDLHAVEVAVAWRLPAIFRCVRDAELAVLLGGWTAGASGRAARLRATAAAVNGPASAWMAGLIEEAERAAQDLPAGAMLDAALGLAARRICACAVLGHEAAGPVGGAVGDALAANLAEHRAVAEALAGCRCPA